jgi:hypothetical protein
LIGRPVARALALSEPYQNWMAGHEAATQSILRIPSIASSPTLKALIAGHLTSEATQLPDELARRYEASAQETPEARQNRAVTQDVLRSTLPDLLGQRPAGLINSR